jgi:response regulator RpfG family c-di-GMP phosphodiesterase
MTRVLIVDDEESIRRLLNRLLEMNGYACTLAASASEARTSMGDQHFELILCDVNMPGESGLDFIRYALSEYPDTAVVMASAVDDQKIAKTALEMGAYGYIIKPFSVNEVMINVANAMRRRKLEIDNRSHRQNLEQMVAMRTTALQETLEKLRKTMEGVVQAMAMIVEARDPYTAGHQRRVADLAVVIAAEMGLSENQVDGIRMAGKIHDLGKISVPAEILSKPGRLNTMEFDIIKTHPQAAYDILKEIDFPWPVAQIILQHHERINGSGYPQGLSGADILLEAGIIGVADVVEAMASHRPYRPALGIDMALEEISKNKGVLYDPEVAEVCSKLFFEKGYKFEPQ